MQVTPVDHDQVFKQLFEAFFQEFLELFCPQEARLIDFSAVEFLREEFFTDIKKGKRKQLDLVVKVRLKAGGNKFVLVHVEFESSRKDQDFPARMFGYYCQLFLRHRSNIVAVAVFSDDATWKEPVENHFELRMSPECGVRFDYHLIKLKHLDYRQFLNSNNPLAFALMSKMSYDKRQRVRLKADFLRLILGAKVDPARQSLLVDFVETYMTLPPEQSVEFLELVHQERDYTEIWNMVTTYEQAGIEKGIQQGMEKGIQQGLEMGIQQGLEMGIQQGLEKGMEKGMEKGKHEAFLLLLEKRFGKLTPATLRKVRRVKTNERLDELLVALLDAKSLTDVPL